MKKILLLIIITTCVVFAGCMQQEEDSEWLSEDWEQKISEDKLEDDSSEKDEEEEAKDEEDEEDEEEKDQDKDEEEDEEDTSTSSEQEKEQVFEFNKEETWEHSFYITWKVNKEFEEIQVTWTDYNANTSNPYTLNSYDPEEWSFEYNIRVDFENINIQENVYTFIWVKEDWEEVKEELVIDVGGEREELDWNYEKDLLNVYYEWEKMEWVDVESFKSLGGWFAKDKHQVFHNWRLKKTQWISTNWLEIIKALWGWYESNSIYAKSKDSVYFNWNIVEWADSETFEYLSDRYAKDKNNVYFPIRNDHWTYILKKLSWSDPQTFEIILCDPGSRKLPTRSDCYSKDKNNVYYNWEIIEWSDPGVFSVFGINSNYAKDTNNVYFRWDKLEWSHPDSFEFLLCNWGWHWFWPCYTRDKNNIYLWDEVISIDNKSFEILWCFKLWLDWTNCYWKDKNKVYLHDNKIDWADSETFKVLWNWYAKDKNNYYRKGEEVDTMPDNWYNERNWHLYYDEEVVKIPWNEDPEDVKEWESIVWTDPNRFEYIWNAYWIDEYYVYYRGDPIKTSDVDTFWRIDSSNYFKDKNNVYYNWEIIEWSDPETFEVFECFINPCYAKDKHHVYYEWEAIKIPWNEDSENIQEGYSVVWTDPREFEYLWLWLWRDENHIYYNWIPSRVLEPDKVNKNDIYVRLNFLPWTKIYRENDLFVYHGWDKIIWSDPETFEIFKEDSDYAKDKYNVYYEWKIQEDKDPETFEP